ncbi:hypothetical protein AAMO2058_001566300 [Amorphochlora amoebiformis]|mmetsp:Transcript_11039/g.17451  ORF Transcript_11039/g.17451 Transcript_11039/m.17451 type:complete len:143 (-) Transcript_11039:27-455(-)
MAAENGMDLEAKQLAEETETVKISKGSSATKRIWKKRPDKRTSATGRAHKRSTAWEKRKRKRDLVREMKNKQILYIQRIKAERAEEKRKRDQRRQYREEQQRKNEIVQIIKDPKKIKKMKKKHLRFIQKADTDALRKKNNFK